MKCPICNQSTNDNTTYEGSIIVEYESSCPNGHFYEHSFYGYVEIYVDDIELRYWYEDNKELEMFKNLEGRELWNKVYEFAIEETKKKHDNELSEINKVSDFSKFPEIVSKNIEEISSELNNKMDNLINEALHKNNLKFSNDNAHKFSKKKYEDIATIFYEDMPIFSYTEITIKQNGGSFDLSFNYKIYEPEGEDNAED